MHIYAENARRAAVNFPERLFSSASSLMICRNIFETGKIMRRAPDIRRIEITAHFVTHQKVFKRKIICDEKIKSNAAKVFQNSVLRL